MLPTKSCELTLYASGFIAYVLCTILEEFCTIGFTFRRCLLVHNNVCCVELTVYIYTQVPPNIQICCYTINKVLGTNRVYIWIHCIRTLYNFGGILHTRYYIRKMPFGTQYCMVLGIDGLKLYVNTLHYTDLLLYYQQSRVN